MITPGFFSRTKTPQRRRWDRKKKTRNMSRARTRAHSQKSTLRCCGELWWQLWQSWEVSHCVQQRQPKRSEQRRTSGGSESFCCADWLFRAVIPANSRPNIFPYLWTRVMDGKQELCLGCDIFKVAHQGSAVFAAFYVRIVTYIYTRFKQLG